MHESYQLFKSDTCGFCLRLQSFLQSRGMQIPMRDVHREEGAFRELLQGGGRTTVPCLRIEREDGVEWMFESADIMRYLAARPAV